MLKKKINNTKLKLFILITGIMLFSCHAYGITPDFEHKLGLGVRLHSHNSVFEERPYSSGDTSYELYYEIHDLATSGFWQIVFGSSESPENSEINKIYSQQLNLIFKDRIYRGGFGILNHCIVTDKYEKWADTYYQFIFGIYISFSEKLGLALNSYYVFEEWDTVTKLNGGDIEYALMLDFKF